MKSLKIIFFCLLLMIPMLTVFGKQNIQRNSKITSSHRPKRSMVFFPSGSSDDYNEGKEEIDPKAQESTLIGISIKPLEKPELVAEENQTEEYTNIDADSHFYDAFTLLEESVDEDIMERSFGGGGGSVSRMGSGTLKSGNRRRPQISIIGAAINALNPITYMRGTFQGFRNVLMQNIMPFKRRFGSNRKDSLPPKLISTESTTRTTTTIETTTTTIKPPTTASSQHEIALASSSETVSSSSSSINPDKSLDLKIPPELVNYAALEVNLKPNGDINIVPVTTRPINSHNSKNKSNQNSLRSQHDLAFASSGSRELKNVKNSNNNGNELFNNGGGSNNINNQIHNNNNDNNNNINNIDNNNNNNNNFIENNNNLHRGNIDPINNFNINNNNNNNQFNNLPNNNPNNFYINHNDNIENNHNRFRQDNKISSNELINIHKNNYRKNLMPSIRRPNIVKLVTDRPIIVESIQDVISFQNGAKNDQIKPIIGDRRDFLPMKPIPLDVTNLYQSPSINPSSQLRLPSLDKSTSPDHIYLLPFRVNQRKPPLKSIHSVHSPRRYVNNKVSKNDIDASEIYYIDITIPDKQDSAPIVNHQKLVSPKKTYRRPRYKRNAETRSKKEKNKKNIDSIPRHIDYDGWQPIDTIDPMSNEPTLVYKPPSLKQVHFGEDPPEEKPFYPVVPVNPPVYVIRAEPTKKEIHSVYGTENVDYLHVNPETDSATAYSAFGTEKKIRSKKERHVPAKRERNSQSLSDIIQSFVRRKSDSLATTIAATQSTNRVSTSTKALYTTAQTIAMSKDIPKTTTPQTTTTSTTQKRTTRATTTTTEMIKTTDFIDHTESFDSIDPSINFLESDSQNETNTSLVEDNNDELSKSKFSEKVFDLDEEYYFNDGTDYDNNKEDKTVEYEYVSTPETDPFASIIPPKFDSNINKEKYPELESRSTKRGHNRDIYIAQASETAETKKRQEVQRASLYELLKDFDGAHFDPYIFSASENDEETFVSELPPPNFRFREPKEISRKIKGPTGRNIEFASKEASTRPWYLIETRGPRTKVLNRRKKIELPERKDELPKRKSKFPNRKKELSNRKNELSSHKTTSNFRRSGSKKLQDQYIYNPYFEEHLNSFKPADSLTANSLSELLQIFKYVTTPSPTHKLLGPNTFAHKHRIFRYTKPTESPRFGKAFTTFRYTIPVSKPVTSTEASFHDFDTVAIPPKILNDTVAETNSLDGYLFSDSVAAPEYTKPDLHPNVIRQEIFKTSKSSTNNKTGESKKTMMDEDAVQRGEIAPPFVIESKEEQKTEDPSPYYIHQGHSQVRVFGTKQDDNVIITSTTQTPLTSSTLGHILISPSMPIEEIATVPASTTIKPENVTNKATSTSKLDGVKYYDINEFRRRISPEDQLTISRNVPKWRQDDDKGENDSSALLQKPSKAFPLQFNERRKKDGKALNKDSLPSPIEAFSRIFLDYLERKSRKASEPGQDTASKGPQPVYIPQDEFEAKQRRRENLSKNDEDEERSKIEAFLSNPFEYLAYLRKLEESQPN